MLVICAKHHGVMPHKTISLVSYPVHKTPNPISLTASCMKIQIFLTYDAVSTGNPRKGLLRPLGWRQQAPPKHLYLFTNRHDVISKKTLIFTKITARQSTLTCILISSSHIRTSHSPSRFPTSVVYLSSVPYIRTVFLNRRAAVRYRALASIIPGRERPEETIICCKISLVQ